MSIAAATAEYGMESTASLPLHSKAPPPHFTLYTFWLSSAVWRIRIALNYKQLAYTPQYVDLLKNEHQSEEYGRISPTHYVPTLVVSYAETQQQLVLGESLAIMEWLEETHPSPPLLPTEPNARAKVRQLALILVAGTQPLINLKLRRHIVELTGKKDEVQKWVGKYLTDGLTAYERAISFTAGTYSFGNAITLADVCLIPTLYALPEFGVDLTHFPNISRIEAELSKHPAFAAAHPHVQPDCPIKQ